MRYLVDTHGLLWLLNDNPRISATVRQMLGDPAAESWVSIVSLWEIAIKARLGKLPMRPEGVFSAMLASGLRLLELKTSHIAALSHLPRVPRHNDPFDHLIMAQAIVEGMTFVSDDAYVARYPVEVLRCS